MVFQSLRCEKKKKRYGINTSLILLHMLLEAFIITNIMYYNFQWDDYEKHFKFNILYYFQVKLPD